jgi:hypothetical protein
MLEPRYKHASAWCATHPPIRGRIGGEKRHSPLWVITAERQFVVPIVAVKETREGEDGGEDQRGVS